MGSQGNPQTWVPFDNIKDCSQGFCSLYCPQWCYFIFPPPPPLVFDEDDSKTNFSPLVIAIIGTLASAFLLVSYYTVISKYCGSIDSLMRRGRRSNNLHGASNENNHNLSNNEAWQASAPGLDEALIKSITVCKYKKGDGFVEGTDCSVCLSEFQEGENLRLLPKCTHAFHLPCIDTWLKSHSNCPLCRANVVPSTSPSPIPVVNPIVQESPVDSAGTSPENQEGDSNHHTAVITVEELGRTSCEGGAISDIATPKSPRRVHYDEEEVEEIRDAIIEIRDEGVLHHQPIRRSISMDGSTYQEHVSVADILHLSEEDGEEEEEEEEDDDDDDDDSSMENHKFEQVGVESSSIQEEQAVVGNDHGKGSSNNSRILHSVMNPTAMKRSFSGGRLLFSRNKRGRNILLPM